MKIATRLALAFGFLVVMMGVVGALNVHKARAMEHSLRDTIDRRMQILRDLGELRDAHNLQAQNLRSALMNTWPDALKDQINLINASRQSVTEVQARLARQIQSEAARPVFEQALQSYRPYSHEVGRVLHALGQEDLKADAEMMLDTEVRPPQEMYFQHLQTLTRIESEEADAASQALIATTQSIVWTALGAVSLVVVAAVLMAIGIIRSITRPLHQAVNVARAVAAGNLNVRIDAQGRNETAQLLQALRDMQHGLLRVVHAVRQGSDTLVNSSAEIARGNQDLSARTESQASALQEAASSMDALGLTVNQNAQHAQAANDLAQSASQIAQQGGQVVAEVVTTMRGISDASNRIAEIISVIDGIAFQTNILALNAAVEAARAGEQGRGFAVVAGEVRHLAHRSAEAAREIKGLIQDSVSRVENGSALVDQAGATMQEVVTSIAHVTQIVAEITEASHAQRDSVSQVGETVTHMDQSTQQNAALVEEMAAAALGLNTQAQELVRAVAAFQVGDADPANPASVAPASTAKSWGWFSRPAMQAV
ncbi:MAG: methyl-accepting chemotaxis protein [Aquabacterium sp.]|uniref:methyl-accepting chemotaxis protein n=1 Tax=Aquabacterium sp. TaxID=1872578 RepID=UPI002A361896|nr:methyl-accepting chemotaxis protein [Aquabacterium sp.]MDX9844644.1 methyl-accepting chemotaxis protein [Aquabacterium sp.]